MCPSVVDKTINLSFLILLLCLSENVLSKNLYKNGEVRVDYPKGCAYLRCKRGDQCVNREFWCKNRPCPSMLYCSKSEKESLKGPSSCEAVRCSKGYICLVRVRHCRWGEGCEQQIARCVSERDYYDGPASCVDFKCPSGLRCILRESLCAKAPCKLLKSCASTKDVNNWLEGCKTLGCLSEHECFLRRSERNCSNSTCKHTPDCSAKSAEELETRELCRGWACPKGQECSAHTEGPCKLDSCRISRSCHEPLIIPIDTSRLPQHSWRDDIKLSFYSKQEKNVSNTRKNYVSSRPATNETVRDNYTTVNKKNATNLADSNYDPSDKVPDHVSSKTKSSSSRSFSAGPDIISGRVGKPAMTSLTTWLNHLKLMTGIDAIEIWIKRADKQENYREFLEWLDSVKDMLGSAAYDLWLEEVRAMTVTSTAFQKWLSPSPTNRTMDSHQVIETNEKLAGGSDEGLGISTDSQDSPKYRNDMDTNDFQPESIDETAGMKNNGFEHENHIIWRKNDTTMMNPLIIRENSIFRQPGIPPSQPTIGMNVWPQLYPPYPTIFPQAYPFQQNFGNILPWVNQARPYQGFNNMGFLNPAYQQFQSNWSFQQPFNNNPDFRRFNAWQDQLFPPAYPQWEPSRDPRDDISPHRRIFDSPQIPPDYFRYLNEDPFKFYSRKFTNDDSPWMNYFVNLYDTSRLQAPEDFGSYPINDGNLDYSSWPSSSYEGQSLTDVSHRRSKHESSLHEADSSRWNAKNEQKSGETLPEPRKDSNLYDSGFPWNFIDLTSDEHYPHILDYNSRNLDDKNNQDGSVISSGLSRAHRVESGAPRLSLSNRYFPDNENQVYRPEYHWTNSYPRERLLRIAGARSPSRSIQTDPLPKLKPSEVDDEGTRKIHFGERINDVPGQSMGLPDLWNSKYRNPFGAIFRKFKNEEINNRDTIARNRPTTTTKSPPVLPLSRRIVESRDLPIARENFHHENDKYEDDGKRFEDYSVDEDDGIYPLLLRLQGYIESPLREVFQDFANPPKNSTILPVYTIDNEARIKDDYDDDYEIPDKNPAIPPSKLQEQGINFFQNNKYGRTPHFLDNLKSVFDVEAALIMQNQTGDNDVAIKDVKWEYEDDQDSKTEKDPPNFWNQLQSYIPSTDGLPNNEPSHDRFGNVNEMWNEERTETDYNDERADYGDEAVPRDRSYSLSDLEQINEDGSLNHEDIPDDLNDRFYDDLEHMTFKKNRPL